MQILHTDLHTFPQRISEKNVLNDQSTFSLEIILFIIITYFIMYWYYYEKIAVDRLWDLNGIIFIKKNFHWSKWVQNKIYGKE